MRPVAVLSLLVKGLPLRANQDNEGGMHAASIATSQERSHEQTLHADKCSEEVECSFLCALSENMAVLQLLRVTQTAEVHKAV